MGSTVAAISTPQGTGGIGTVRISGSEALAVADKVFLAVSGAKLADSKGYRAYYGRVTYGGRSFDDAVAVVFRAPHSYTGEDVAELTVHGGSYVTRLTLRAVLEAGASPAGAGEFTKRAFLNGKMDLAEAEAVMGIVSASGEKMLKASRAAADGAVSEKLARLRSDLLFAAATVSAFTDFPDEEPSFSGIDKLPVMLSEAEKELALLIDRYDSGKIYRQGVRTAIIGSTNVGKSTLMNLLSGSERSIVTSVAGTTRDVIEETVMLGDVKLCLSDTAGLRDTEDEVERIGVERSRRALDNAELVIFVADGSKLLSDEEKELAASLRERPSVAVLNKTDIGTVLTGDDIGLPTVLMSAKNGSGTEELRQAIEKVCGGSAFSEDEPMLVSERQRDCASRALREVRSAIAANNDGYTVDAVGACISSALAAIMELTGESVTAEVADEVFRNFCVGK